MFGYNSFFNFFILVSIIDNISDRIYIYMDKPDEKEGIVDNKDINNKNDVKICKYNLKYQYY